MPGCGNSSERISGLRSGRLTPLGPRLGRSARSLDSPASSNSPLPCSFRSTPPDSPLQALDLPPRNAAPGGRGLQVGTTLLRRRSPGSTAVSSLARTVDYLAGVAHPELPRADLHTRHSACSSLVHRRGGAGRTARKAQQRGGGSGFGSSAVTDSKDRGGRRAGSREAKLWVPWGRWPECVGGCPGCKRRTDQAGCERAGGLLASRPFFTCALLS